MPKTAKPDKEVALVQGAILDISQIKERVSALHLEAGPSTVPFHAFAVETSDDLQQWRRLLDDAQLVRLQQGGQVIAKDTFELDGAAGKYLRLVWREPTHAPPLVSASVVTTLTSFNGAHMLWTEPIAATVTKPTSTIIRCRAACRWSRYASACRKPTRSRRCKCNAICPPARSASTAHGKP